MAEIPSKVKVLVVGGGPAGSTAATLLARQGHEVALLEKDIFPRYHIGESLLPTILPILDFLGAREKVEEIGFQYKRGAYLDWGRDRWRLDFGELSENTTYAFQVTRSEFDYVLLEHAKDQGVNVFEGVEVKSIEFEDDRPCTALWSQKIAGKSKEGSINFGYMIDGSGRTGLLATKYLENRKYHSVFQNVAIWGYWEGTNRTATGREGDIVVSAIDDGWLWSIPLHDGTTSIGLVMHKNTLLQSGARDYEKLLMEKIGTSEVVSEIVRPGRLVTEVRADQDYSYFSQKFCGPGYFIIGDAACFLDPLLSSGVHLATFSALLASASLSSLFRAEITERDALNYFEKTYRQAYLRFLVFLSAFYDVGRKKENYFWEAQRLTREPVSEEDLHLAFLKLVTGIEDFSEAQEDEYKDFIVDEMTRRVDENLSLRRNKAELARRKEAERETVTSNNRFFSSVEGLFAIDAGDAVDGYYIVTEPELGLARARSEKRESPEKK